MYDAHKQSACEGSCKVNTELRHDAVSAFRRINSQAGMTLAEVLIASGIFAVVFASIMAGLSMAGYRSEYARFNLAAGKFVEEAMERCRNAPWDPLDVPVVDMLTSSRFTNDTILLDTFAARGSPLYGARTVTITSNSGYKVIHVQVVWAYKGRGPTTNTLISLRAPDR
jgi:type II secretory pathway pseudopilin PulG